MKLADEWPESGPRVLWKRKLGDGYSSIVSANRQSKDPGEGRTSGATLFTMYRSDDRERIVALNAETGETIWEHKYEAEFREGTNVTQFGPGPLSTPLIVDDRILSVSIDGQLRCLDLANGKLLWKHDLPAKFGRLKRDEEYGYSASPLR